MDFQIIEKEAFRIIGKGIRVTMKNGGNFRRIPQFWSECEKNGLFDKLAGLSDGEEMFGVCTDFDPQQQEFTYMIAMRKKAGMPDVPDNELTEKEIPAFTWAVFEAAGPLPHAIQQVWKKIFSEWLPVSGYEHADGPQLEVYPPGDPDASGYVSEVWIPVVRKQTAGKE